MPGFEPRALKWQCKRPRTNNHAHQLIGVMRLNVEVPLAQQLEGRARGPDGGCREALGEKDVATDDGVASEELDLSYRVLEKAVLLFINQSHPIDIPC